MADHEYAKRIMYETGLSLALVLIMIGHAPSLVSIEDAKRAIDLGHDLGGALVERIREDSEKFA